MRNGHSRALAGVSALVLMLTLTDCGRSSTQDPPATATAPATVQAGAFGDLGRICEPGKPDPKSGRGLNGTTVRLGTIGDPGSAYAPGLEQEYFDVGTAFTKWCNAAGGINGRKIVLDKWDAKLFNGASAVIKACQQDFMLVGNGNAFDAADVKPRLACKLGQIPALNVSREAAASPLQVQPTTNDPSLYGVGPIRALEAEYPAAKQGLGIGSSNNASLSPQGRYAEKAFKQIGIKVTTLQEKPAIVTNFRPYMEQLRTSGAKAYNEIASVDPGPEVTAMNDIGWKPAFVLWSIQFYDPKSVAAAKAQRFPPSYVSLAGLPAELVNDYPVLQQIRDIMKAGVATPKFTSFTGLAFSAWALWAKSASECGNDVTQACILAKAGVHTDWDAGGLFPPHSIVPGKATPIDCYLLVRLTPQGFVYDKKATKPNRGPYNCGPGNLVHVAGG